MGCSELWQWQPWLYCLVLGALCAEDASLLVCFSWDCSVHCWGDSRWFSLVKRWRMNETDVTGIKKRQTRSRFWTGLMIRSHFLLIWIFSVASLLFRWTALLVSDCCGNNNKEKKMKVVSLDPLCTLWIYHLKGIYVTFSKSLYFIQLFIWVAVIAFYPRNVFKMLLNWFEGSQGGILKWTCHLEQGLPWVSEFFGYFCLKDRKQSSCQPPIGAVYYKHFNLEKHWEKWKSMCRFAWESHRWTASCAELLL